MVINIGMLKAGDLSYVADEIRRLKAAVGDKVLKVIIETCLLTDEEKIAMCKVVTDTGADFIKNVHRLLHRGRDLCRHRALCQTCGAKCENQGCGRHFHFGGRGALRGAGRQPSGHQPDYQAAQGKGVKWAHKFAYMQGSETEMKGKITVFGSSCGRPDGPYTASALARANRQRQFFQAGVRGGKGFNQGICGT